MQLFTSLYSRLDETTQTTEKLEALKAYFRDAPAAGAVWAVYFLSGRRLKRLIKTSQLREWILECAGIPSWLFEECYETVGDLAETIALLLPPPEREEMIPLHRWVEERLLPLRGADEIEQRKMVLESWTHLPAPGRYVWNKFLTGGFRVGVSQQLVIRALAELQGLPPAVMAHRLMGNWEPSPGFYYQLLSAKTVDSEISRPYPFFLAYPLKSSPDSLGNSGDWQMEWKWDGIRTQVVSRRGQVFLWSRGEELVTERFPEITQAARSLPEGTVLDGEIVAWREGKALSFSLLQRRIGRKSLTKRVLDEIPVVLVVFDLLENSGRDVRNLPLADRRGLLAALWSEGLPSELVLSPLLDDLSWDEAATLRADSRNRNVEGLMLKRKTSPYGVGRRKDGWWKWKIDPFTVDAVLIYAQRGHGRRASLYSDYTFGVWSGGKLIPFAKAYSGLTEEEIRRVDRFVRNHTIERFGPVHLVEPELVFELAFEGIQESSRHKSGVAVRLPRMVRWRNDKKASDADSLQVLKSLLPAGPG